MTLFNRIQRRWNINRTVRELSRLDNATLSDIGLIRGTLTETVEQMIDSKGNPTGRVQFKNLPSNYHITSGAAA